MDKNNKPKFVLGPGEITTLNPSIITKDKGIIRSDVTPVLSAEDSLRAQSTLFTMEASAVYHKLYSFDGTLPSNNKEFCKADLTYGGVRLIASLHLINSTSSTSTIRVGIALCVTQYARQDLVWANVVNGNYSTVFWPASQFDFDDNYGMVAYIENTAGSPYYVTGTMYVLNSTP
jgi:hypothetical protein